MDYTELTVPNAEHGRVLLITDIHNCNNSWCGMPNSERMEFMLSELERQYRLLKYDCIICLGDYSLDFWMWHEGGSYLHIPPVSNTRVFMEKYYPRFPVRAYMIPGNHEQYGNEKWKEITGFNREYCLLYGDCIFAMLDTFAGNLDPTANSDGTYTGINTAFLKEVLKRHPQQQIFLCAHYIDPEKENREVKELIASHPNIKSAFIGHRHISTTVISDDSMGNIPIFFCGNFSYPRVAENKTEYFGNTFMGFPEQAKRQWGYRILEIRQGCICTDYISVL